MNAACQQNKGTKNGCPGLLLFVALLLCSSNANAENSEEDSGRIYLQLGGYAHFTSGEERHGLPILASIDRSAPRRYYYGLALFNNSFNQFSQFLYVGREFPWKRVHENIRFRVSVGVIYGYRDGFEDKLPVHYKGLALGLVPSIGYKRNQVGFDMALLGAAGLMFTVGYEF